MQKKEPADPVATLEEFRSVVRQSTTTAVDALRSALCAKNPVVKLGAAKALLEFAWGKPAMSVQHTFSEPVRHKVFHLVLTDDTGMSAAEDAAAEDADAEGADGGSTD